MDLAFNPKLWALNHGLGNRQRRLVIRFRNRIADGLEALSMVELDRTDAGWEWSPQELDIDGLPGREELAMVVGELIPKAAVPPAASLPMLEQKSEFDPQRHPVVVGPLPGTRKVAFKLWDPDHHLYVLADKRQDDGLCSLLMLPPELNDQMAFYEEFTVTPEWSGRETESRWNWWALEIVDAAVATRPPGQGQDYDKNALIRDIRHVTSLASADVIATICTLYWLPIGTTDNTIQGKYLLALCAALNSGIPLGQIPDPVQLAEVARPLVVNFCRLMRSLPAGYPTTPRQDAILVNDAYKWACHFMQSGSTG